MWQFGFVAAEAKQAARCEGAMSWRQTQTSLSNSPCTKYADVKEKREKIFSMIWQVFAELTGTGIAEIDSISSSRLSLADCLAAQLM